MLTGSVRSEFIVFTNPGTMMKLGEAQFTTLWQSKDGNWQITHVISFDHHSLTK
jgi:hypothetical protein